MTLFYCLGSFLCMCCGTFLSSQSLSCQGGSRPKAMGNLSLGTASVHYLWKAPLRAGGSVQSHWEVASRIQFLSWLLW